MIGFSGSNLAQNNDNAVGQENLSAITTEDIQKKNHRWICSAVAFRLKLNNNLFLN